MPTNAAVSTIALASACLLTACNNPPATAVAEPARTATEEAPPSAIAAPPSAVAAVPSATATPPGAASARVKKSPAEAKALLAAADKCLKDAACDPAKADALYRDADDAGAEVSCFRFYYGIGVTQDLPRARACFERQAAAEPCKGNSPLLVQAYLATMLVDGQGGPAEPARVKSVFADCYKDATAQALEEEADKRTLPSPLDFCDKIGGTTITIGECHTLEGMRIEDLKRRVDRDVVAKLDPKGKQLADKARALHAKYADKEGEAGADKYRGGSIHSNAWKRRENELENQRVARLAHLFDYKLTPGADPAEAEKDLEKAYKEALDGDAQHKKVFADARRAWTAYRDAEIALYVHALGDKLGKREVETDVKAMLTREYTKELEDAIRP